MSNNVRFICLNLNDSLRKLANKRGILNLLFLYNLYKSRWFPGSLIIDIFK